MPGKFCETLSSRKCFHQENVRVIFGIFVSGNGIFECYVFVKDIFRGLCLWVRIFDICHEAFRSLIQNVGLSYLNIFGCASDSYEFRNEIITNYFTTQFWGNLYSGWSYYSCITCIQIYQLECILVCMMVYIFIYIKCLESIQATVKC